VIFLTLGTHQPFDRLVRAVDRWCRLTGCTDVFGQITDPGPGGYRPAHFAFTGYLPAALYAQRVAACDFMVAHAGMGSIITALSELKPIVVMPRRAALGEQRNDHQLATAERFRRRPGVAVAEDEDALIAAMARLRGATHAAPLDALDPFADERFTSALSAAIRA